MYGTWYAPLHIELQKYDFEQEKCSALFTPNGRHPCRSVWYKGKERVQQGRQTMSAQETHRQSVPVQDEVPGFVFVLFGHLLEGISHHAVRRCLLAILEQHRTLHSRAIRAEAEC